MLCKHFSGIVKIICYEYWFSHNPKAQNPVVCYEERYTHPSQSQQITAVVSSVPTSPKALYEVRTLHGVEDI